MIVRANAARFASTDITIKSDESLAKELNDNMGTRLCKSFVGHATVGGSSCISL